MNHRNQTKGLFISFEGGEGAGKSTQVRLLARYLDKQGYKVKVAREPGGTKIGEAIRAVTHNPAHTLLSDRAEALLLAAGRAQIVDEIYRPFLAKGYVVIADRYVDSSYAYQGFGRGLGFEPIKMVNDFATGRLMPEITFWLKIDRKTGHKRRQSTDKIDRLDMQKASFYKAVDIGYQVIANQYKKRIITIDANQKPALLQQKIIRALNPYLKQ